MVNLQEMGRKIKRLPDVRGDIFFFSLLFLLSLIVFLGYRISTQEDRRLGELRLNTRQAQQGMIDDSTLTNNTNNILIQGQYVGSRGGQTYHLPSCPGAKMIKEINKIWFQSKATAEQAGYKPAGNCPGI